MDRSRLSRFINQALQELPLEGPAFVSPNSTAREALALMREGSRSCVLTSDDNGHVLGIFTERDVLNKCMQPGFDWDTPLSQGLVTESPRTINVLRTVGEAVAVMQQHHYRTLPVLHEGKATGIVRLGNLITQLAEAFPEDVLNLPPRPNQVMDKQHGG